MRILFIAHRIPYPPNKGDKIRSFHEVRHLGGRHEVWLACLADDPTDLEQVGALEEHCCRVTCEYLSAGGSRIRALRALLVGKPMSVAYFHHPRLAETVARWLEEERFDVIVTFSSQSAQYVWPASRGAGGYEARQTPAPSTPRVMDLVDVDSQKYQAYARWGGTGTSNGLGTPLLDRLRRRLYSLEARRLAHYEAEIARRFDRVVLVSDAEREVFTRVVGETSSPPVAITNGVDTDYFAPGDEPTWPGTMVFSGAMDYPPNVDAVVWLAEEILPLVRERLAGGRVRLRIVGARPNRAVLRLKRIKGVEVVGTVPDIRPYVRTAAVSVAPMRIARGIQNKVLEAMAMGVPVVTTTAGLEGLSCQPGREVLVADEASGLAEAIVRVLTQPDLAQQLGERGRQYVLQNHSWTRAMQRFEEVLFEVVERSRTTSRGAAGPV